MGTASDLLSLAIEKDPSLKLFVKLATLIGKTDEEILAQAINQEFVHVDVEGILTEDPANMIYETDKGTTLAIHESESGHTYFSAIKR